MAARTNHQQFAATCGLLVLATGIFLTGCSDPAQKAARDFVHDQVPAGIEVVDIRSVRMTENPDGEFVASIHVQYRALENLVSFKDGFSTAEGRKVGRRMDGVRDWALSGLTESDPARVEIEEIWSEARSGFAIKRVDAIGGDEFAGTMVVRGRREGDGWTLREESNSALPSGRPDERPDIPIEGTEAAKQLLAERTRMAFALESIQTAWQERERRAEESLGHLRRMLRAGVTFDGTLLVGGAVLPLRLVISRGLGDSAAMGVLTDYGNPVSSIRMVGRLAQTDTGEFAWRISETEVIAAAPGAAELFDPRRGGGDLLLVPSGEGLKGRTPSGSRIEFDLGGEVDVLEEPPD